jgi:type IV pilus assembly protein PilB
MDRTAHREGVVARLLERGLIDARQVDLAETERRRRGGTTARMLCELGFLAPEQFASAVAQEAGTPLVEPSRLRWGPGLEHLIPIEMARRLRVLPVGQHDGRVTVAMADPSDVIVADQVRRLLGYGVEVVAASEREILNALDEAARSNLAPTGAIHRWLETEPGASDGNPPESRDVVTLEVSDAPVVQLVEEILGRAVEAGASDVHFEPAERWLRTRFRVDGLLVPDVLIPKPLQSAVTTRLKVLADLDVAEARVPQDGQTVFVLSRRRVHLRLSSLPTQQGESVVVRLLPDASHVPTIAGLGLDPELEARLRGVLVRPDGVIIVTGPTGSGKTTTLYALLGELNQPDTAVFTLEDPVEMGLVGVRQTQIHEEAGLTYAVALRALLRQDPDVILVGETRDSETAQLTIRAALTGHQVLTTLHTNDALGAVPRLVDLGVDRTLLPASLRAIVAQRLVRRLCVTCRRPADHPEAELAAMGIGLPEKPLTGIHRAVGCAVCQSSGYRGRRAIFELFVPDDRCLKALAGPPDPVALLHCARETGMKTLFEDGLHQVLAGITSMEEVLQVTRLQ